MVAIGTRSGVRAVVCALACATLLASTVSVAAAAGTTDIGVAVEPDSLEPGATTTVDIIVEDADDGVGALNATVTLSNPASASVEDVTIHGDPDLENVSERPDGVKLSAALADTADSGSVTVATVVLRAEEPGETVVGVDIRVLGDENGERYDIAAVDRPTLAVTDDDSSSSDSDGSDGGSNSVDDAATDGASTERTDGSDSGDSQDSDGAVTSRSTGTDDLSRSSSDDTSSMAYVPVGAFGAIAIGAIVLYWHRYQ